MDDFARFFDNSLDLNGIASADGYFRRVNIAWERTLGWRADEISASPWLEFVHPGDRQATIDAASRLFARASIISFENRYRCKDGSYRLIQWHAEAVGGEAYCSGRDVTEVRSQLALRAASLEFKTLVDNLPELAWTARPDGFIDFYNRRWYEYTGTTYKEMEGWGWQSVHHQDELPRVMESWTRSISTRQPFDQAFPLRRKDGVFRWFLTRVAPIFDDAGELVRWVGISTDIDDQRRDQEALREIAAVVESADDAIITKSLDGTIRSWNPGARRLLGYRAEDIVGLPVTRLIPEERWAEEAHILAQIRAGKHVLHFETVRRKKDGSLLEVSLTVSPIHDRSGSVIAASKIMRDITERKQGEQERMRLVAELQTLNSELEERVIVRTRELTASVKERETLLQEIHHRVKNNLQVISSLINMQVRKVPAGASRDALEECQTRVQAIALIHEQLYQSRDYSHVPFSDYARSLASSIFHATGVSPSIVTLDLNIEALSLAVDKAIPCGLILNELITNALKHAFPNERRGVIRVGLHMVSNREARLSVADDGIGLPASHDMGKSDSLGMQLVSTLVEQLEGRLDIARSDGTTFSVTFPAEA